MNDFNLSNKLKGPEFSSNILKSVLNVVLSEEKAQDRLTAVFDLKPIWHDSPTSLSFH